MKTKITENTAEFIDEIRSGTAPIIVLFTENPADLSDSDSEILKNSSALTVIAGGNLSAVSNAVLAKFDLRITEKPAPVTNADDEVNAVCAVLCGENSAYRYSQGEDISGDFFTVLSGEDDFRLKTEQYLESLAKDKDEFQLYALAKCFRTARNDSPEAVFEQESLQFYRLMQRKSKEAQDGIQ
ncbi:MAG: hypothetical protein NC340_09565 [Ruminococcus flavefaciens]|nr:hypothetical protein [Ruminococcus flavefaciens]MCM1232619.1 hypothetical protein [Ruminococcus flavefaciens]